MVQRVNILRLQWVHMLCSDSFIMDARDKLLDIILRMLTLACTLNATRPAATHMINYIHKNSCFSLWSGYV